jgi:hypothetical protein
MKTKKRAKGWKVFNKGLKCRDYQFKKGEWHEAKGRIEMCENGFHFHEDKNNLFTYYDFNDNIQVAEVEAIDVQTGDDKSVCRKIKIVKVLTKSTLMKLVNSGKDNVGIHNTGNLNTGYRNTGDRNTGDLNTGDLNTGYRNTGDRNTGDRNTGDLNTGYRNTGYRNTGYRNTGYRNTGDRNTGDLNTTNFCSGLFCTKEQKAPLFNGAAIVLMSEFRQTENYNALFYAPFPLTEWIYEDNMTDEEKKENPKFHVQQGYLKERTYKEACKIWWENTPEGKRRLIQEIPGFDKEIFNEITGIEL